MSEEKTGQYLTPGAWPKHVGKFGTPPLRKSRSGSSLAEYMAEKGWGQREGSLSQEDDSTENNEVQAASDTKMEKPSYRGAFIRYAEYTSLQGVPFINRATRWYSKLFWCTVLLGSVVGTGFQTWEIYTKYMKRETTASVKIGYSALDFPSITFCNINPLRNSKKENFSAELRQFLDDLKPQTNYTYGTPSYNVPGSRGQGTANGNGQANGQGQGNNAGQGNPRVARFAPNYTAEPGDNGEVYGRVNKGNSKPAGKPGSATKSRTRRLTKGPVEGNSLKSEFHRGLRTIRDLLHQPFMRESNGGGPGKGKGNKPGDEEGTPKVYYEGQYGMGNVTDGAQNRETFKDLVSNLSYANRVEYGHQLDDMLLACSFNGHGCDAREFTTSLTSDYGNCFTYNTADNHLTSGVVRGKPMKSLRSGVNYGMQMLLYIQDHEYLDGLTTGKGMRLSIHPFNTSAFVVENGISLSPGAESFVGMKMVQMERIGVPYEPCDDDGDYLASFNRSYTIEGCINTCPDRKIAAMCGCYRKKYPQNYKWQHVVYNRSCQTHKDDECIEDVLKAFQNESLSCNCRQACQSVEYELEISNNYWPDEGLWFWLVDKICSISEEECDLLRNELDDLSERYSASSTDQTGGGLGVQLAKSYILERNFLAVNIYYRDLNYETIVEVPEYGREQFVADFGGVVGLWFGATFISAVELLDLFLQIVALCCTRTPAAKPKKEGNANNNCLRTGRDHLGSSCRAQEAGGASWTRDQRSSSSSNDGRESAIKMDQYVHAAAAQSTLHQRCKDTKVGCTGEVT